MSVSSLFVACFRCKQARAWIEHSQPEESRGDTLRATFALHTHSRAFGKSGLQVSACMIWAPPEPGRTNESPLLGRFLELVYNLAHRV
jgi:hypothetical protein